VTLPAETLPAATVGVFDSGLGGLTVLREIRRQMPGASVLYLADTANVPYGDKPLAVVRDLALRLTDRLADSGARLVVMASGTSTVAGLEAARARHAGLPIVGTIEPGALAALEAVPGPLGVLSTDATARSLAFTRAVHALDPSRRVVEQGCPRFVPLVESGRAETPEAEDAACEYLAPLRAAGVQGVILGCTHFPFLLPALARAARRLGDPAFRPPFVDPSEEAVRRALAGLTPPEGDHAAVHFAASGDPEAFRRRASALLGEALGSVLPLTF
jgi:glutamate racemase